MDFVVVVVVVIIVIIVVVVVVVVVIVVVVVVIVVVVLDVAKKVETSMHPPFYPLHPFRRRKIIQEDKEDDQTRPGKRKFD